MMKELLVKNINWNCLMKQLQRKQQQQRQEKQLLQNQENVNEKIKI